MKGIIYNSWEANNLTYNSCSQVIHLFEIEKNDLHSFGRPYFPNDVWEMVATRRTQLVDPILPPLDILDLCKHL